MVQYSFSFLPDKMMIVCSFLIRERRYVRTSVLTGSLPSCLFFFFAGNVQSTCVSV
nr:MAG TPA: hypothetical protein [Bacteriophage sp.]